MSKLQKFKAGDRVIFAATFLRNTGHATGDPAPTSSGPFAVGTVQGVLALGGSGVTVINVNWDNGDRLPALACNLWPEGKRHLEPR